ncbi:hypothetical protein CC1G_07874 [Coprinopsis cinerea okayama7|uniref:Aminotransferase class I/classII large domain-containing protein n=1 Tax=Coprinopsis cinerea (strain Okayama-7 / 130 / ATCC MYA-4618 / FGSC 9003) TaxID=240176 RepID=A8P453_COPC7|nr:hypothetical protein CC1G_07874 [Coprinopsis cinerea okayama7\|eukprot:XP_001838683.1 hypothetical protein CC1G_07874 [Coprinopsis cinerea okayama7\
MNRLPESYYTDFLSDNAKQRKPSPIRGLFPLEKTPGLISLLAGKPNAETFPFSSLSFTARSPTNPTEEVALKVEDEDLKQGLQYGDTAGMKKLLDWLFGLQEIHHGRKRDEGWRISVGSGSQDLIYKAVQAMVNPGDPILVESPVYAGVIPMFHGLHCEQVDDPYFYLYYGKAPRYPSYFSLEREEPEVGRVLRFDSLSKILSAGVRIGFASGPEKLLQAIDAHTATSNLQTSSLTQTIIYTLLNSWGYDGFKTHTERVADFYRQKRDVFENAMKKHLAGLADWSTPEAGMFFWFKLILNEAGNGQEDDSAAVIRTTAFNRGVLALPGESFLPNGQKTAYVRASFSLTPPEDVEKAVQRLRDAILDARRELKEKGASSTA